MSLAVAAPWWWWWWCVVVVQIAYGADVQLYHFIPSPHHVGPATPHSTGPDPTPPRSLDTQLDRDSSSNETGDRKNDLDVIADPSFRENLSLNGYGFVTNLFSKDDYGKNETGLFVSRRVEEAAARGRFESVQNGTLLLFFMLPAEFPLTWGEAREACEAFPMGMLAKAGAADDAALLQYLAAVGRVGPVWVAAKQSISSAVESERRFVEARSDAGRLRRDGAQEFQAQNPEILDPEFLGVPEYGLTLHCSALQPGLGLVQRSCSDSSVAAALCVQRVPGNMPSKPNCPPKGTDSWLISKTWPDNGLSKAQTKTKAEGLAAPARHQVTLAMKESAEPQSKAQKVQWNLKNKSSPLTIGRVLFQDRIEASVRYFPPLKDGVPYSAARAGGQFNGNKEDFKEKSHSNSGDAAESFVSPKKKTISGEKLKNKMNLNSGDANGNPQNLKLEFNGANGKLEVLESGFAGVGAELEELRLDVNEDLSNFRLDFNEVDTSSDESYVDMNEIHENLGKSHSDMSEVDTHLDISHSNLNEIDPNSDESHLKLDEIDMNSKKANLKLNEIDTSADKSYLNLNKIDTNSEKSHMDFIEPDSNSDEPHGVETESEESQLDLNFMEAIPGSAPHSIEHNRQEKDAKNPVEEIWFSRPTTHQILTSLERCSGTSQWRKDVCTENGWLQVEFCPTPAEFEDASIPAAYPHDNTELQAPATQDKGEESGRQVRERGDEERMKLYPIYAGVRDIETTGKFDMDRHVLRRHLARTKRNLDDIDLISAIMQEDLKAKKKKKKNMNKASDKKPSSTNTNSSRSLFVSGRVNFAGKDNQNNASRMSLSNATKLASGGNEFPFRAFTPSVPMSSGPATDTASTTEKIAMATASPTIFQFPMIYVSKSDPSNTSSPEQNVHSRDRTNVTPTMDSSGSQNHTINFRDISTTSILLEVTTMAGTAFEDKEAVTPDDSGSSVSTSNVKTSVANPANSNTQHAASNSSETSRNVQGTSRVNVSRFPSDTVDRVDENDDKVISNSEIYPGFGEVKTGMNNFANQSGDTNKSAMGQTEGSPGHGVPSSDTDNGTESVQVNATFFGSETGNDANGDSEKPVQEMADDGNTLGEEPGVFLQNGEKSIKREGINRTEKKNDADDMGGKLAPKADAENEMAHEYVAARGSVDTDSSDENNTLGDGQTMANQVKTAMNEITESYNDAEKEVSNNSRKNEIYAVDVNDSEVSMKSVDNSLPETTENEVDYENRDGMVNKETATSATNGAGVRQGNGELEFNSDGFHYAEEDEEKARNSVGENGANVTVDLPGFFSQADVQENSTDGRAGGASVISAQNASKIKKATNTGNKRAFVSYVLREVFG